MGFVHRINMPDNFNPLKTKRFLEEVSQTVRQVIQTRCSSLNPDDGEDISQDVMIKVLRAVGNGTKIDNLRSYIWRAAYTTALDLLAERGPVELIARPEERPEVDALIGAVSTEELFERKNARRWIEGMIETLPEGRRRVFRLYLIGLSTKDIAAHLGWSHSKVRHIFYRGVEEMKRKSRRDEGGRPIMVIGYD